jgi:Protein of unknown function (DUF501)
VDDRALVERQLGRPPRAFRRVVVRCPWGLPAVTEQWAYDEAGEPFPTTYYVTCRHLVAAIARLEAAGGVERWSAAVLRDRALAESLELGNEQQRMLRRDLVRGNLGADGGASLELGIGGAGRAQVPARARSLRARPAGVRPRRPHPRGGRVALARGWLLHAPERALTSPRMPVSVDSARLEWEEGNRRLEASAHDRRGYRRLLDQVDALLDELGRRVGQTFTLEQLAEAYAGAERWSRDAIVERAPSPGWAGTLSIVEAAAFYRYQRGAIDYTP